jgi:hypothetical protein
MVAAAAGRSVSVSVSISISIGVARGQLGQLAVRPSVARPDGPAGRVHDAGAVALELRAQRPAVKRAVRVEQGQAGA